MNSISDRLDSLMRSRGIRGQSQLARETGVGQSTINRILKSGDSYSPSWETLRRLAAFFHVTEAWLAEGRGDPQGRVTLQLHDVGPDCDEMLSTVVWLFRRLRPEMRQTVLALLRELDKPHR